MGTSDDFSRDGSSRSRNRMRGSVREVVRALRFKKSVLVTCHEDPDPDGIGSAVSAAWAMEKLGVSCRVVVPGGVPERYGFIPLIERVPLGLDSAGPSDFDAVLVVDCDLPRTGAVAEMDRERDWEIINIDHHQTNFGPSDVEWIDPEAPATCLMIYELIGEMGLVPDKDCASSLYTGLLTDTGGFRFANTTPRALSVAAELTALGADPAYLAEQAFEQRSANYIRLLGFALQSLDITHGGRVSWLSVSRETIEKTGATQDEIEGVVNYGRMIRGVSLAIILRELPDGRVKVGFRSRAPVDVGRIAQAFGGGGHSRAAGCIMEGTVQEIRSKLEAAIPSYLPPDPVVLQR